MLSGEHRGSGSQPLPEHDRMYAIKEIARLMTKAVNEQELREVGECAARGMQLTASERELLRPCYTYIRASLEIVDARERKRYIERTRCECNAVAFFTDRRGICGSHRVCAACSAILGEVDHRGEWVHGRERGRTVMSELLAAGCEEDGDEAPEN